MEIALRKRSFRERSFVERVSSRACKEQLQENGIHTSGCDVQHGSHRCEKEAASSASMVVATCEAASKVDVN